MAFMIIQRSPDSFVQQLGAQKRDFRQDLFLNCLGGWNWEYIDSEIAEKSEPATLLHCTQNTISNDICVFKEHLVTTNPNLMTAEAQIQCCKKEKKNH